MITTGTLDVRLIRTGCTCGWAGPTCTTGQQVEAAIAKHRKVDHGNHT